MVKISDWYANLGEFSFPTIFINLNVTEQKALLDGTTNGEEIFDIINRLTNAIKSLPGSGYVAMDSCAADDSLHYRHGKGTNSGKQAWKILATSEKVKAAINSGDRRLIIRPIRRIDRIKEFRLFFYNGELKAMSQYLLTRHFARFAKRHDILWSHAQELAKKITPLLPNKNIVVDVYLRSDDSFLIIDLNDWAGSTDPKLLKSWDRDWSQEIGLKLISKPIKMKGDISVSF